MRTLKPVRLVYAVKFMNRLTALVHVGIAVALIIHPHAESGEFISVITSGWINVYGLAFIIAFAGIRWLYWPMHPAHIVAVCSPLIMVVSVNTAYLVTASNQPLWPPVVYYGYVILVLVLNWYYFLEAGSDPLIANTSAKSRS